MAASSPVPMPAPAPPESAFFGWIRDAGIVRTRGWFGGVAAGIAGRTGIDVALIRGIFVVITLFGFPAVLLYAILWLVLPDESGAIPLQLLCRGRFQPQMIGILATFLFALIPFNTLAARAWQALTQPAIFVSDSGGTTYYSGTAYDVGFSYAPWGPTMLAVGAVVLAIIAAVLIVAAARRRRGARAAAAAVGTASMVNVASADGVTTPAAAAPIVAGMSATPGSALGSDAEPWAATPAVGADEQADASDVDATAPTDPDEFAQWREQHAQAQRDREAFLVSQQDDASAKQRAERENADQRGAFLRQLSARRAERRATNPRASVGYNLGIIGLAAVVACVVILTWMPHGFAESLALGAFSGGVVLGLGMVLAGAMRRRSGFLALATVAALAVGGASVVGTRPGDVVWDGASVFAGTMPEVNQPFGALTVYASPSEPRQTPLNINKGEGYTVIFVEAGIDLEFEAALSPGSRVSVSIEKATGEYGGQDIAPTVRDGVEMYAVDIDTYREDLPSSTQKITLEQTNGWVEIVVLPDWSNGDVSTHIDPKITVKK